MLFRSGAIRCTWMNQAYLNDILKPHVSIVIFGDVKLDSSGVHFLNPEFELVGDDLAGVHAGRIVPFYEKAGTVTPNMQRKLVRQALDDLPAAIPDLVPAELRERLALVPRRAAIEASHFPPNEVSVDDLNAFRTPAQRRMIFEEFFLFQIGHAWRRHATSADLKPVVPKVDDRIRASAAKILPFKLTPGQKQALKEIVEDMLQPQPMHRLLQGDVGAGKTLVAVSAMLSAVQGGHQGALMAPTEVLAEQHAAGVRRLLQGVTVPDEGSLFGDRPLRVELLTNRIAGNERREVLAGLADGSVDIAIGTHALIQEGVEFHSLGVVVVDEQHRFGVEQRAALKAKGEGSVEPDVLVMTATPIPRTAAMTVYGDLDVSVLDELPPGRTPITTEWVNTPVAQSAMWQSVRDAIGRGEQVYVVCPLIEESEKLEVASAQTVHDELSAGELAGTSIGLLHGRMSPVEKEATMERFRSGDLDVLVATTVIEVGVDVPNATQMVILDADRFGIAQLHQLRGRVGRGAVASSCFLLTKSDDPSPRVEALVSSTDGFVLAEADLQLRGEGTVMGTIQKGRSDLRLASLQTDLDLIQLAREVAVGIVGDDPSLAAHPMLRDEIDLYFTAEQEDNLLKG